MPDEPVSRSAVVTTTPSEAQPELPDQRSGGSIARPADGSPDRIVLTGFMGAGKSTVGPILARILGWRFLDVDQQIEAAHGRTIAQLFADHGEPWFRALEQAAIESLLRQSQIVLALGGGAIEESRTLALLLSQERTRLIHLEATLETVVLRCHGTDAQRPILRDRARLEERYTRRLPLYRQAHLSLTVDNLTPEQAAAALLAQLNLSNA